MRILLVVLTLLLPLTPALAQDTQDPIIFSLETGVICAPDAVGERLAPDTVAGATHLIDENPAFVSRRNRVPAVIGIGFGIKAQADGIDLNDVTMSIQHPPMGTDGVTEQSFLTSISGTNPSLTFYQFDHDYELLPGTWEMRAFHDGRMLYSVTFKVVPPRFVPELAGVCGFENLLS